LKTEAFYVGTIGSRANNAKRRERLKEFDLTEEQIARLHGPIGLYIGSKTPPEIAVSILAEMTAVKNGVALTAGVRVQAAKDVAEGPASLPTCGLSVMETAVENPLDTTGKNYHGRGPL
jgi:xanthine dehydrogenase accessory factor